MLPAAKALLVTLLLGGGTVGTFALAGGFGPGGSGTGNGEATAQVSTSEAAKPAAPAPKPEVANLPEAEATRNGGDNAVDSGIQQRTASSDNGQVQQPSSPDNNQTDSQLPTTDRASEGRQTIHETNDTARDSGSVRDQSVVENGKADLESEGVVNNPSDTNTEGTPGSSPTSQQEASGANAEDEGRSHVSSDSLPASSSNPGDTTDRSGSTGTDATEIRTASGGEEAGEQGA